MRNELEPDPGAAAPPSPVPGVAPETLQNAPGADSTRANERFLARVSELLNSSLDYRATIQSVARLCTEHLAEYCIVHVENGEDIRALGIAHRDISRELELREILRLLPIGPASPHPVVQVLRTGRPLLMAAIGDIELASISGASPHGERLRELGLSSVLLVPLMARGRTLGAISLARSRGAPSYDGGDLALVEELGRRAALAVDNARLYREARREARARERTLGVVSHDLRNALNAATVHSELLLDLPREQLAGAPGRRQLVGLRRTLVHMQRLVQDLLDAENIESGRFSLHLAPLDLRLLRADIEELFAPLAEERRVTFTVDLPASWPGLQADHVRIVQVLGNLIGNALDFTPRGGSIRVRGEGEAVSFRFSVEDTGSGIPAEDLPHVFERHWRGSHAARRTAGSGLGLTIVRGIVRAHGGACWVESEVGVGSRFYFSLPAGGAG